MTLDEAIKHHALDGDVQVAQWLLKLKQVMEGSWDQTLTINELKNKAARLQMRLNDETLLNNRLVRRIDGLERKLRETQAQDTERVQQGDGA